MASTRGVQLTQDGKRRLEEERRVLREEKLRELSERIQRANEEGDVTDNSEYEDLKDEYMHAERRVREIEYTLEHAIIIEEGSRNGVIDLGSHLSVETDDGEPLEEWILVSAEEADPLNGRISDDSPVGKQLLGKKTGDTFVVKTPDGDVTYRVVDVK
ncbi:MAG TPA: GreA/GreB family elongation factor [Thermomicrobiales bacterium]|nr:GreA/GreB family elongation factor [Thermomicrobiales bacterium]